MPAGDWLDIIYVCDGDWLDTVCDERCAISGQVLHAQLNAHIRIDSHCVSVCFAVHVHHGRILVPCFLNSYYAESEYVHRIPSAEVDDRLPWQLDTRAEHRTEKQPKGTPLLHGTAIHYSSPGANQCQLLPCKIVPYRTFSIHVDWG